MNLVIVKVKNVSLIIALIALCFLSSNAQGLESHKILNSKLKKSSFKKLLKEMKQADVIFFGEMHDDPISHWLELKVIKALKDKNDIVIGLEMFERDTQENLDKYLQDKMDLEQFETEARTWNNYKTDYAPIVNFAKSNNIKVVATNIPRSYASMVYKNGFEVIDNLVSEEKKFIAPLPIEYDPELPGYKNMAKMVEGHGGENFPKAQAIKDATMAYSIAETYEAGKKYVHLNGKYHSDSKEGIIWYLNRYKPGLKVLTISTVMSDSVEITKGLADFIIVVDADMTKTF